MTTHRLLIEICHDDENESQMVADGFAYLLTSIIAAGDVPQGTTVFLSLDDAAPVRHTPPTERPSYVGPRPNRSERRARRPRRAL